MIKAKELRLGNWVESSFNHKDGKAVQLDEEKFHLLLRYGGNEFYPIPLTPEILEKCGFEKLGELFLIINKEKGGFPVVCISKVGQAVGTPNGIDINERLAFCYTLEFAGIATEPGYVVYVDYVHQLQNLYFALTGNELEVKL